MIQKCIAILALAFPISASALEAQFICGPAQRAKIIINIEKYLYNWSYSCREYPSGATIETFSLPTQPSVEIDSAVFATTDMRNLQRRSFNTSCETLRAAVNAKNWFKTGDKKSASLHVVNALNPDEKYWINMHFSDLGEIYAASVGNCWARF